MYTWLKRYFPRYSSEVDVVEDEKKKEKRITLNRTYEMLCKEKCGTVCVIDEITINVCSVMTMLAERDMVEFAEESKLVVGLPSSNPFVMKKS